MLETSGRSIRLVSRELFTSREEVKARCGRSTTSALRLPDALVIAPAVARDADRILTTDAGWPGVPIRVEVLSTA